MKRALKFPSAGHALRAGDDRGVDRVLKFTDYEVQNAEPLVTASLTSRLRKKLGAQKLAWLVGVTQIILGSLIALTALRNGRSARDLMPRGRVGKA